MIGAIAELSAPALFAAGLAASPHCALMCGAINAVQARTHGELSWRKAQLLTNAGRVLGYALLGALAGGAGGVLLAHLPQVAVGRGVQILAALLLVATGVRQFRAQDAAPACCAKPTRALTQWPLQLRLLLQGLAWAAMPCAILYGVLLLAALSASAADGALLVAAFGLGTTPLLWATAEITQRLSRGSSRRTLQYGAGVALVALGVGTGAAILAHDPGVLAWCASRLG